MSNSLFQAIIEDIDEKHRSKHNVQYLSSILPNIANSMPDLKIVVKIAKSIESNNQRNFIKYTQQLINTATTIKGGNNYNLFTIASSDNHIYFIKISPESNHKLSTLNTTDLSTLTITGKSYLLNKEYKHNTTAYKQGIQDITFHISDVSDKGVLTFETEAISFCEVNNICKMECLDTLNPIYENRYQIKSLTNIDLPQSNSLSNFLSDKLEQIKKQEEQMKIQEEQMKKQDEQIKIQEEHMKEQQESQMVAKINEVYNQISDELNTIENNNTQIGKNTMISILFILLLLYFYKNFNLGNLLSGKIISVIFASIGIIIMIDKNTPDWLGDIFYYKLHNISDKQAKLINAIKKIDDYPLLKDENKMKQVKKKIYDAIKELAGSVENKANAIANVDISGGKSKSKRHFKARSKSKTRKMSQFIESNVEFIVLEFVKAYLRIRLLPDNEITRNNMYNIISDIKIPFVEEVSPMSSSSRSRSN